MMGTKTVIAASVLCLSLTAPAHAGFGDWLSDVFGHNEVQTQPEGGGGYSANAGQYYDEANRIRSLPNADSKENRDLINSLEQTGRTLDNIHGTNSKIPPKAEGSAVNADTKFDGAGRALTDSGMYDTPNTLKRAEKATKKAKKAKNNFKKKMK